MRVEAAPLGEDVGVVVVDTNDGPVVMIDPSLSPRRQAQLLAELLTDDEFEEMGLLSLTA